MERFIRNNRILIISLMFLFMFVFYFTSFAPTNNELKQVEVENFYHISTAKYVALNNTIESEIENTKSMSSRTAIKNKIVEYIEGGVTFQELYDFSYSKYLDGYSVLDNAVQAMRIVDEQILIDIGVSEIDLTNIIETVQSIDEVEHEIFIMNDDYRLQVISPIVVDGDIIGHDVMIYSLNEALTSIQRENYEVDILVCNGVVDPRFTATDTDYVMTSTDKEHIYCRKVSENYKLRIIVPDRILFEQVQLINIRNIIIITCLALIVLVTSNIFIMKNVRELVSNLSSQQEHYRTKAMYDALTKTYSRQFLAQLLQESTLDLTSTTVVMTDVNGFKQINDEHGHLVGDEVLQFVGRCLLQSFRKDDYVIRYGGDEFLIIVNKAPKSTTENIMKRINDIINQTCDFPFEISISYGIGFIHSLGKLEEGIEEADRLLYQSKNKNK